MFNALFALIDRLSERERRRSVGRPQDKIETGGVWAAMPRDELLARPYLRSGVLGDEYRAWEADKTDQTPYPLRHIYYAEPYQPWTRRCDGLTFETLGTRLDSDRLEWCQAC